VVNPLLNEKLERGGPLGIDIEMTKEVKLGGFIVFFPAREEAMRISGLLSNPLHPLSRGFDDAAPP